MTLITLPVIGLTQAPARIRVHMDDLSPLAQAIACLGPTLDLTGTDDTFHLQDAFTVTERLAAGHPAHRAPALALLDEVPTLTDRTLGLRHALSVPSATAADLDDPPLLLERVADSLPAGTYPIQVRLSPDHDPGIPRAYLDAAATQARTYYTPTQALTTYPDAPWEHCPCPPTEVGAVRLYRRADIDQWASRQGIGWQPIPAWLVDRLAARVRRARRDLNLAVADIPADAIPVIEQSPTAPFLAASA